MLENSVPNPSSDPSECSVAVNEVLKENSLYHALSETIPVQIWTATPEGQLDYVSEQTARVLGIPAEKILAEGWQTVVHPEDLPQAIELGALALHRSNL